VEWVFVRVSWMIVERVRLVGDRLGWKLSMLMMLGCLLDAC
jgi:hypothetical protein